jgi:hypothetical protein
MKEGAAPFLAFLGRPRGREERERKGAAQRGKERGKVRGKVTLYVTP